jgi:hypothetical protein
MTFVSPTNQIPNGTGLVLREGYSVPDGSGYVLRKKERGCQSIFSGRFRDNFGFIDQTQGHSPFDPFGPSWTLYPQTLGNGANTYCNNDGFVVTLGIPLGGAPNGGENAFYPRCPSILPMSYHSSQIKWNVFGSIRSCTNRRIQGSR